MNPLWKESGEHRRRSGCRQDDELSESRREREVLRASAEPRAAERVTHRVPALLPQSQRTAIELRDRLCEQNASAVSATVVLLVSYIDF